MLFLWAICMVPFGAYTIIQNLNKPIQTQPQLFCFLCLICWSQTLYYANKYKPWQAGIIVIATAASFAAAEVILVFTLRIPYNKGVTWPITTLGIFSAVLLDVGLVFPFIDAAKRDWRIIGISFRFLVIDFAGAFFSLLSLVFQNTFDKLGGASYISVMILEIGIVLIQLSWVWRKRKILKEARKAGKTYDEYIGQDAPTAETSRSSFVRVDDAPSEWDKSCRRMSDMFSAIHKRHESEKEMSQVEKGLSKDGYGQGPFYKNEIVTKKPAIPAPTYLPSDPRGAWSQPPRPKFLKDDPFSLWYDRK